MNSSDLPDYVRQNVANWTEANAEYTDAAASAAWAQEEISWGVWETPELQLNVLGDVRDLDIVELFAPAGAEAHTYYKHVTAEWAQQWPAEELWVARKHG